MSPQSDAFRERPLSERALHALRPTVSTASEWSLACGVAYIAAVILGLILGDMDLIAVGALFGVGALVLEFVDIDKDALPAFGLIAFVLAWYALASIVAAPIGMRRFLMVLANFGVGISLARRIYPTGLLKLMVFGVATFLTIQAMRGVHPNAMLGSGSQNAISVVLMAAMYPLLISQVKRQEHPSLWPIMFGVGICLWSTSRSGIVTMAALLAGTILITRPRLRVLFLIAAVAFVGFVLTSDSYREQLMSGVLVRFQSRGFESDMRADWVERYVELLDVERLLFGLDIEHHFSDLQKFDFNIHNSFLQSHSQLGLGALAIFAATLWSGIRLVFRSPFLALLLLTLLARAYVDSFLSFGEVDYLLIALIFAKPPCRSPR